MIRACGDKLEVRLNTSYRDILPYVKFQQLVFTGPIDEFFDFQLGHLPYRSLRFEAESFTPETLATTHFASPNSEFRVPPNHFQPAMQVNYPGEEPFTRIVEIKHATGQDCPNTTIVREYPDDFGPGKEPYYPIPAPDSSALYKKYKELADQASLEPDAYLPKDCGCTGISFIGRLATYRYYNMDQVVGMALKEFEDVRKDSQG
jgi:UDP-galactopyranose mutase